jgi:hypothetical protein
MKQKLFYFPKESSFVSDEQLAVCFGWPDDTPHEIWKAVNNDDVRAYYYYCINNILLPEVLHIQNQHIFMLAFNCGSWVTCIWIVFRIFRDYEKSFWDEIASLVSNIEDDVLIKFVRRWVPTCADTFLQLACTAGPDYADKWVKIFRSV